MKRRMKIGLLFILLSVVSCPNEDQEFIDAEPVQYLELYISFEEPKMVVYGQERELITFKRILENASSFSMSYYPSNIKNAWITDFCFYSDELIVPLSSQLGVEDRLNIGEIKGIKNGAFSLTLSWQEEIQIQIDAYLVDGVYTLFYDTIFLFTPSYFDTSSCAVDEIYSGYGPRPCTLTLNFMGVEANIIRARRMLLDGRRRFSYGLTFKEVERDEHGILFELFLINNREIET